jgi:tRNA(fMet)-specific endonuclease VapC
VSGRFLLDTEVVVALLRGDATVQERLREAEEVFVSSVTLGELYYGALRSIRAEENREAIHRFAQAATVLAVDARIALSYADLKHQLREKGRPIPENDLWIAATARGHELELVSSDVHFKEIDGLPITSW